MPKLRPNPPYLGARWGKRVAGRRVVNIVGLKKTAALASIVIGLASSVAVAEPLRLAQAMPAGPMPPREIVLVVRSAGLLPTSEPTLAGATYVVRAVDPYGTPMRVIIDARTGSILSVHRIAATEPPHPPYGALGMRERPYNTANEDTNALVPPRGIPMRPPPAPDRPLSGAPPVHPPLPKPRAAMAPGESPKPPPAAVSEPPSMAARPGAPPAANQAAKQESFPPVTPLQ
jgi:hypothetical protein